MTYGIAADRGVTLGLASRWTRFLGQMIDGSFAALPMFVTAFIASTTGGPDIEKYFAQFGGRLPNRLQKQLEKLKARLG